MGRARVWEESEMSGHIIGECELPAYGSPMCADGITVQRQLGAQAYARDGHSSKSRGVTCAIYRRAQAERAIPPGYDVSMGSVVAVLLPRGLRYFRSNPAGEEVFEGRVACSVDEAAQICTATGATLA
jgi:hypothetical protein